LYEDSEEEDDEEWDLAKYRKETEAEREREEAERIAGLDRDVAAMNVSGDSRGSDGASDGGSDD
jgi:hypothetical protein